MQRTFINSFARPRGQVRWTLKGSVDKALIGRAEQVDTVKGISSSYACRFCCPNKFYNGFVTPDEITGLVDDFTDVNAFQQDMDCYGHIWSPYNVNSLATWTSSDDEVLGFAGSGAVQAVGAGYSSVVARWSAQSFFADVSSERCEPEFVEALTEAFLNVLKPFVTFGNVSFSPTTIKEGADSSSILSGVVSASGGLTSGDNSIVVGKVRAGIIDASDAIIFNITPAVEEVRLKSGETKIVSFKYQPVQNTLGADSVRIKARVVFEDNPAEIDIPMAKDSRNELTVIK